MRHAFSLVELSIVLVILGLLVGGILAGQSLIRAAELRSVGTEYNRLVTATHSFRDKYFALPGDMSNATQFWGSAGGTGGDNNCAIVISTTTATCNGNGNGRLESGSSSYYLQNESFRFWQHLANAGLIEGSYTGRGDPTPYGAGVYEMYSPTPGLNVLASKLSRGAWTLYWTSNTEITTLQLGRTPIEYYWNTQPIMSTSDLWNVDSKLDDGGASSGKIQAAGASCISSGAYVLTNSSIACILRVYNPF